jgi:hypothetical protein
LLTIREKAAQKSSFQPISWMYALTMCCYYGLLFQVEFLIRNAKQYTGLEDCEARSKEKLHTHFNVAFSAVFPAKCAYTATTVNPVAGQFLNDGCENDAYGSAHHPLPDF